MALPSDFPFKSILKGLPRINYNKTEKEYIKNDFLKFKEHSFRPSCCSSSARPLRSKISIDIKTLSSILKIKKIKDYQVYVLIEQKIEELLKNNFIKVETYEIAKELNLKYNLKNLIKFEETIKIRRNLADDALTLECQNIETNLKNKLSQNHKGKFTLPDMDFVNNFLTQNLLHELSLFSIPQLHLIGHKNLLKIGFNIIDSLDVESSHIDLANEMFLINFPEFEKYDLELYFKNHLRGQFKLALKNELIIKERYWSNTFIPYNALGFNLDFFNDHENISSYDSRGHTEEFPIIFSPMKKGEEKEKAKEEEKISKSNSTKFWTMSHG